MDGWIKIGTKLETKSFDRQIEQVQYELEQVQYELSKKKELNLDSRTIDEYNVKVEILNNKLIELKRRQKDLDKADLDDIKQDIEDIGNSTSKTIKKVSKWALAIFGIRSAYMFIRKTVSTLSQYNEQLAKDIEYIEFSLASILQPVIESLIKLVYKLLIYINYIANAWFGINLFANASVDAMNKSAKSAEKMKKALAGFDEMNIINDTSSSSTSNSNSNLPSVDLSSIEGEVPSWIQWIAENGLIVAGIITAIGTAIGLIKLANLINALSVLWTVLQPIIAFIGTNATLIGGIILILGGLSLAIEGIINYFKDPTWENFGLILLGVGIIAGGVLLIFGGFPALIALIIGIIVALGIAIYKNWDKIKTWTLELVNKIKEGFGNAIQWVKDKFNAMVSFFSNLISKIVGLFKTIGTKVGNVIGNAFKTVINGVLSAIENILNFPINSINKLINVINKIPGIDLGTLPTFSLPRLAVGGIVNMPGRGIPVGSAMAGEAGKEGVIPLTDSQAMEELGSAIGRYITINATLINQMNGRTISRELKKVQNESAFATNR